MKCCDSCRLFSMCEDVYPTTGEQPPCASKSEVAAHSTSDNTSMDAIAQITDILDNRDDLDSECKITLINIIIGKQHHR